MQKTARKNTKYSRNETMLKIGHLAKSIAFAWQNINLGKILNAKYSVIWAKKHQIPEINSLKLVKIDSVFTLE